MKEKNAHGKTTELPTSGAPWYAILFAAAMLAVGALGMIMRNRRRGMESEPTNQACIVKSGEDPVQWPRAKGSTARSKFQQFRGNST